MSSQLHFDVDEERNKVIYNLLNNTVRAWPFSHIVYPSLWPSDLYDEVIRCLPTKTQLSPIKEKRPVRGYDSRYVLCFEDHDLAALDERRRILWSLVRELFLGGDKALLKAFFKSYKPQIEQQYGVGMKYKLKDELLLVNDRKNYSLGPHTDSPIKFITFLMYLPLQSGVKDQGTSLYIPKARNFVCKGGPHHQRSDFDLVFTAKNAPNTGLSFLKNERSFHGVEPHPEDDTNRWLLLYDIQLAGKPESEDS